MSRWEPNAEGRLQRAALELFADQGFENTTVAEIAERAGLTERTFFRYFADKREVLFAGAEELQKILVDVVHDAPPSSQPLSVVAQAFESINPFFEQRREGAQLRQAVIKANPELRERELIKMATLAAVLAGALRERGVSEPAATLASEAGVVVFRVGIDAWLDPRHKGDLTDAIRDGFSQLEDVSDFGFRRATPAPKA